MKYNSEFITFNLPNGLRVIHKQTDRPVAHLGLFINAGSRDELENEGFAREVMRKVQSLRKDAGFEKTDSIILHLQCSKEMVNRLNSYKKEISEKVGAQKMVINFINAAKKHQQKTNN